MPIYYLYYAFWLVYFTYVLWYFALRFPNKKKSPLITKCQSDRTLWLATQPSYVNHMDFRCWYMDVKRHKIVRLMNVPRCILSRNTLSSYACMDLSVCFSFRLLAGFWFLIVCTRIARASITSACMRADINIFIDANTHRFFLSLENRTTWFW